MNRFTKILATCGAAMLVTGATMIATAGAASASPGGLSCGQLQADYDNHLRLADRYQRLGDDFASEGSPWQAESWFAASRDEWVNAMNVQVC